MNNIVVTDIFGKTGALETLCRQLDPHVTIIDPYDGKPMNFKDEPEAYDCFMKNVGLEKYAELLLTRIQSLTSPTTITAFSIGASATWMISEQPETKTITRAVCFYGSQIRKHTRINPAINIDLVLPGSEPSFDIEDLANQLSTKNNVHIHITPYLHGFMNTLSKNFNQTGYNEYLDRLRRKTAGKLL